MLTSRKPVRVPLAAALLLAGATGCGSRQTSPATAPSNAQSASSSNPEAAAPAAHLEQGPRTIIDARQDIVTLINVFTVKPENQQAFMDAQTGEYQRLEGQIEGSLSANLHRSLDSTRLVNVAQFRSLELFRSWVQSDLMKEHGQVIRSLIERSEPGLYRVVHVTSRVAADPQIAQIQVTKDTGKPITQIDVLTVSPPDHEQLIAGQIEAAQTLLREIPGLLSISILQGLALGLTPPKPGAQGAQSGAVGDPKIQFSEPKVAVYIQLADQAAVDALTRHEAYRQWFTTAHPRVREALSRLYEVVFIQNQSAAGQGR